MLLGAEQYYAGIREKSQKPQTWRDRLITRANAVPIFDVLEDFFKIYHPRDGGSYKGRCPFGEEHPDGGMDKGWRTYPATNSSYCFVQCGSLPPARLLSVKYHEPTWKAAERILRYYDLLTPAHYTERFESLSAQASTAHVGDPQYAIAALHTWLNRIPEYLARQFDTDVTRALELQVSRLEEALEAHEPDALLTWLEASKLTLEKTVKGPKP